MRYKEGYAYHIRDEYLELVHDCNIKQKPGNGSSYPAYLCKKDTSSGVLWMIPMSTNITKYKAVYDREMTRYNHCYSIVIGAYDTGVTAFLIQEMYPVLEKHVLHTHTRKGKAVVISPALKSEIRHCFNKSMELSNKGIKCIYPDINRIKQIILSEENLSCSSIA